MPPTFVRPSGTPPKMPIAASAVGRPTICVLRAAAPVRCTRPVELGVGKSSTSGQVALERRSRAAPTREVTEAAERAALAERRVAAGEREAELRRHELEDVDRHADRRPASRATDGARRAWALPLCAPARTAAATQRESRAEHRCTSSCDLSQVNAHLAGPAHHAPEPPGMRRWPTRRSPRPRRRPPRR